MNDFTVLNFDMQSEQRTFNGEKKIDEYKMKLTSVMVFWIVPHLNIGRTEYNKY